MRILAGALILIGCLIFMRYYKHFPLTLKGIIARILAIILIAGWIILVLKVR